MTVLKFLTCRLGKKNRVKGFERKIILDNFLIGKTSTCANTVSIRNGMKRGKNRTSTFERVITKRRFQLAWFDCVKNSLDILSIFLKTTTFLSIININYNS